MFPKWEKRVNKKIKIIFKSNLEGKFKIVEQLYISSDFNVCETESSVNKDIFFFSLQIFGWSHKKACWVFLICNNNIIMLLRVVGEEDLN